jgi:TonB family protein
VSLAPLALCALAAAARAQEPDAWASISPEGESFTVKMPGEPSSTEHQLSAGELKVEGRRYVAVTAEGVAYVVLSLRDTDGAAEGLLTIGYQSARFRRESFLLDEAAKLAREALAPPGGHASLSYRREFELSGRPAREYYANDPKARGPVYVCADGLRIYVAAVLAADLQAARLTDFFNSFELKTEAGAAETTAADAATAAGDERAYTAAEVTQKARILSKPEPLYTEDARHFQVTGTVAVRVVLAASGEVARVEVERGLPHGMTLSAVEAARKITFEPARKDGRPVAQYAAIQYNFNIY